MALTRKPRLYLAGPEVFLPDAVEHAHTQRRLCEQYGFIGLHPMDNNVELGERSLQTAVRIYRGDIAQIRACDIVVANCNAFRGLPMDDGTAYEIGFANALGKPAYGYIASLNSLTERTRTQYPCRQLADGTTIDQDGYLVTDDFGTSINLMMQCGMLDSGGRLIESDFEACLQAIREDMDSGRLSLGPATSA